VVKCIISTGAWADVPFQRRFQLVARDERPANEAYKTADKIYYQSSAESKKLPQKNKTSRHAF